MDERRLDVFFYGLFMDQQLLDGKGVHPTDVRPAVVPGFELRIGPRAAPVPTPAGQLHGLLRRAREPHPTGLVATQGAESCWVPFDGAGEVPALRAERGAGAVTRGEAEGGRHRSRGRAGGGWQGVGNAGICHTADRRTPD